MMSSDSQKASAIVPDSYGAVLGEVKTRIRSAQLAAFRAVNRELVAPIFRAQHVANA